MFSSCLDHLNSQPLWIILISSLGFLSLFKNATSLLKWLYNIFLRPAKDLRSYGLWALITGSTDGIGKAFAFKLAGMGMNLVLVSRNSAKLKRVSSEIRNEYPNIDVKIFELDFSGDVVAGVSRMKEAVKGLDIGVLINNVGVTYPEAMYFDKVDEKIWMNLVRVNVIGTTFVTGAVVPGMVARGRGAIVNIGSGASVIVPSHPLYAIYAATKGYVDQLSRSLYVEYKHYGIDVQCQVPLYVSTKMASQVASVGKSSVFIPTAEKYVESAIRFIGHDQARYVDQLSRSLYVEYKHYGIDVQCQPPRLSLVLSSAALLLISTEPPLHFHRSSSLLQRRLTVFLVSPHLSSSPIHRPPQSLPRLKYRK